MCNIKSSAFSGRGHIPLPHLSLWPETWPCADLPWKITIIATSPWNWAPPWWNPGCAPVLPHPRVPTGCVPERLISSKENEWVVGDISNINVVVCCEDQPCLLGTNGQPSGGGGGVDQLRSPPPLHHRYSISMYSTWLQILFILVCVCARGEVISRLSACDQFYIFRYQGSC